MQSRQYAEYEESVLWQLKFRHKENTIDCPVIMTALYYMPNRKSWPDLIGLLQATCDILEKAEILVNDRLVVGFGDRRIAGIDKQNPHVDIGIDLLDSAVHRRFDVVLSFPDPTIEQKEMYVEKYMKRKAIQLPFDKEKIEQCTSYSDLEHEAVRLHKKCILSGLL